MSSASQLVDHQKKDSPSTSTNQLKSKIHACQHCEETFTEKFNLKTHINDVHERTKRFKCDCNKEFSRLHNLKRHQERDLHPLSFDCPSCGKKKFFISPAQKEKHLIQSRCGHGYVYNTTCQDVVDERIKKANMKDKCYIPPNWSGREAAIKLYYEKNKDEG